MYQPAESKDLLITGDTVYVPSNSPVLMKLKVYTVNYQDYLVQLVTTGVVKPLSGHLATVAVPFEGRIARSFIKLGQKVIAGAPLFEVSSSDYMESVRSFIQAKSEKELAEKNYLRKKDLLEKGICSRKDFDEASLQYDLAGQELEKTKAMLRIFGIDSDETDIGQPLIVRSPISGEIVNDNIVVGQYLKSGSDPVVTVADLNKIWVVARVKEKDLGSMSIKDKVEVFTESQPGIPIKGLVDYIGNIMNEQTRSVEVYIECENPAEILKAGMFVTVRFYHRIKDAIIIPATSVLQGYNKSFVFLQAGPYTYLKKEVMVTSVEDNSLIVHAGLEPGNMIVTEGAIYLR